MKNEEIALLAPEALAVAVFTIHPSPIFPLYLPIFHPLTRVPGTRFISWVSRGLAASFVGDLAEVLVTSGTVLGGL